MIYFLYYVPLQTKKSGSWLENEILANFETEESISCLINHLRQRIPEIIPVNIANKGWMETVSEYPVFNYTMLLDGLQTAYLHVIFLKRAVISILVQRR